MTKIEQIFQRATIVRFETEPLGNDRQIFRTTIEELTCSGDNAPILDAIIRALESALQTCRNHKAMTS